MGSRLASWLALLLFYNYSYLLPHMANWWDQRLPPHWLSYFHFRILIGSPQSQLMGSTLASSLALLTFTSVFLLAPQQSQLMGSTLASSLALLLSYPHSYWLPTMPTDGIQACFLIGSLTFISSFLLAPQKANQWAPRLLASSLAPSHYIRVLIGSLSL